MYFLSLRKMALPAGAEHATGYTHIWKILLYKKWLFGIDDLAMCLSINNDSLRAFPDSMLIFVHGSLILLRTSYMN